MILLIVIIISLMANFSLAQEIYAWEVRTMTNILEIVPDVNQQKIDCGIKSTSAAPTCSEISDDLCDALWSNKNQGQLIVIDGKINVGESGKSEASASRIEDLKALVNSASRLPVDLRKKAEPILNELKSVLDKENDSKDWYRSLSMALYHWETAMSDIAEERAETKNPQLKNIKSKNLSIEQEAAYQLEVNNLQKQVLDAKYADHPNWKRVLRVFDQAKKDMIAEINDLNISESQKKEILSQVGSIKVSLPYADPKLLAARESCASTEMNAFYSPLHHTFTVCAGYFNSFQSDAALYGTIAHEISHSIDPISNARQRFLKESALNKSINKLVGSGGMAISCKEWDGIVSTAEKTKPSSEPLNFDGMQKLYDCLQPKMSLAPYTPAALNDAAERLARELMSSYASAHSFLTLAQPTFVKDGQVKENAFYLRPDLYTADDYGAFASADRRNANVPEIFVQALLCQDLSKENGKIGYKEASKEERSKLFNQAMEQTQIVLKARMLDWFSYCGKNCSDLASERLSVDSSENFADWLAYKAIGRSLERHKDVRQRREVAALSAVDLCSRPGVKKDAPDLAAAEKEYSLENHPDARIRRISVFNKKNAELIQCEINKAEQGFGLCEL